MTTHYIRCVAVTLTGVQCTRNATMDDMCTQHYKITHKIPDVLPKDVLRHVLSDYIGYDQLTELQNDMKDLDLDIRQDRVDIKQYSDTIQVYNSLGRPISKKVYVINIIIDGVIRNTKKYYNDSKVSEVYYNDAGKKNGKAYAWYDNGTIKDEDNYKDGLRDGVQYSWWPNRVKSMQYNYKDGLLDGVWTTWYDNGTKDYEKHYKNDKLEGVSYTWFPDGTKWHEQHFKDGKKDGTWYDWWPNRQLHSVSQYRDGVQISINTYKTY